MRKSTVIFLVGLFAVAVCILIAGWASLGIAILQYNPTPLSAMNLHDIEQYLGISVPSNATNVTYWGTRDRAMLMDLNFSIPSKNAAAFLNTVCGGRLYQGYNPFDAMNFKDADTGLDRIRVDEFVYYSYSPNTPSSQFGNRCGDGHGGTTQVLVDKSAPDSFAVRIQNARYCNLDYAQVKPCAGDAFDTKPLRTSSVVFRNVNASSIDLNWWCIDLDSRDDLSSFMGSDVRIEVDGEAMKEAYVSSDGRLDSKEGEPSNKVFNYCLDKNSKKGSHQVSVKFLKPNTSFEYSLRFSPVRK